jgi:hypothetical protein
MNGTKDLRASSAPGNYPESGDTATAGPRDAHIQLYGNYRAVTADSEAGRHRHQRWWLLDSECSASRSGKSKWRVGLIRPAGKERGTSYVHDAPDPRPRGDCLPLFFRRNKYSKTRSQFMSHASRHGLSCSVNGCKIQGRLRKQRDAKLGGGCPGARRRTRIRIT